METFLGQQWLGGEGNFVHECCFDKQLKEEPIAPCIGAFLRLP
jgi:hypothetical protein